MGNRLEHRLENWLLRTTLLVSVVLVGSKFTGFLRDVALAYSFGTSMQADAFVLAQSVQTIFSYLLFVALGIALIPVYTKLKMEEDQTQIRVFIHSIYSVAGTLIAVFCVLGFFFADGLVFLLAPGFPEEAHWLGVWLTRITLPAVFFTFLSTIQGQQLRAENQFLPSAFIAYPLNLCLVFALLALSPLWGIRVAAYAYVLGSILQVLLLWPFVRRTGYRFHYHFDLKNPGLRRVMILTLPIMLGNTLQAIDSLLNRILASGLAEGSMAALNYSNKLSVFLVGIVSLGAGTVCFTRMSELGARKEVEELKLFLSRIIALLNLIMVPASLGMMALSVPITRLVYEYGAFDSRSSQMTATTLWFYAMGLSGFVLRDIITRAFYALDDAKTPMINGGIAVVLSIAANLLLVGPLGIGGLALATSLSGILGTVLLLLSFRHRFGPLGHAELFQPGRRFTFPRTCLSGFLMGLFVHQLYPILELATGSLPMALLLSILTGAVLYLALLLLFHQCHQCHQCRA